MFSYTRIILDNTELSIYQRGLEYVNKKKVKLTSIINNGCQATASGSRNYEITLGFSRVGSPKYSCSCPYFSEHKKVVCKHIIGTSLAWDRSRSVPDPDEETLEVLCIPEPIFSHKDINEAYNNPLTANLDVIRIAADESGWSRPHAHLPIKPQVCNHTTLELTDINKGISELRAWARKYNFDPYFCAGEIMAGFCELIRFTKFKFDTLNLDDKIKATVLLANFHHELIMEKIDDSEGLHEFSETHLYDLVSELTNNQKLNQTQIKALELIKHKIDDY
ncbi:MAG: SWIM zinc finger family protein [bacterium]|nr:SWIM zinc finger family protein [bacterium]